MAIGFFSVPDLSKPGLSKSGLSKSGLQCWFFLSLLACAAAIQADDVGTGVIAGKVLDRNGQPLAGASIGLEGTTLKASTDFSGSYRLAPAPAGERVLKVSYLGLEEQTIEVEVVRDETRRQRVTLEPYGDEVRVLAEPLLEGQARALNQQKSAINIMNIVAADQIGRFPDANAAEATQRIPGIALQRDQGEGRYILVRGTEARLNSTTINGERIPSPEGEKRDVALGVIPADLLQAIEVAKALTPDMDADAIGGSVNLVTKRAPEQQRLAATLGGGYNDIADGTLSVGTLAFGRRYLASKLGMLLSVSTLSSDRGSDNFEVDYDDGFLDELELRDYTIERQRVGLTAALDLASSERSSIFFRGLWNKYDDHEVRRRKRERVGKGRIERELRNRELEQEIISLSGGGHQLRGGKLVVDYRLAWNLASEDDPARHDSTFRDRGVDFDPNVRPDLIAPDDIRANPLNEDAAGFLLSDLKREDNSTEETDLVARLDLSLPFYRDETRSGMWKLGAKSRFKDKQSDDNTWIFEGDDIFMADFLDTGWASEDPFLGGRYDIGPFPGAGIGPALIERFGLIGEKDVEKDLADFEAGEDTLALYGMIELQFGGQLTFLGGARYEYTEIDYQAHELIFDQEGDFASLETTAGGNGYGELMPMAHLVYALDSSTNLRAAITRTLARPNYENLAPFQKVNREDLVISRGNPDLGVTVAWNFDLLFERYLSTAGLVSAGLFHKRLDDNIFSFVFEETRAGDAFTVVQPMNGGSADLLGFELAFQSRLRFLPSPWDGLGLYFNYTYTDSRMAFPGRPDARLQGQPEHLGNLAASYEKGGFSGRVSLNYHGEYLAGTGGSPANDVFIDEHLQVDLAGHQRITRKLSVFFELVNLTDEPHRVYQGSPDRPIQEEYYKWWGTVGFKLDF